ncbi:hypothetical protein AXF42_Ash016323 [Apostasia shenzhenica]|uniref:TLC domain-containing protein n=1 Tax=Apostasia shenzhenica TaxID=1088818 RepID=A0A2H9ZXH5_9ASPA|nr:hypothetical protein AXF42_Ash016323 [Apostasia shenzhenica]
MASRKGGAAFFRATFVLWSASVAFEIAIKRRAELSPVVAGFTFFQAANLVLRSAVSRDPLFVNTAVSLLHSSITSACVILILANQWMIVGIRKMFEHAQLFDGMWPGAYTTLCFSCGYFAYDQLDMLKCRLYSGRFPLILAHHLVLLICFTLALYRRVTINYLILTLFCELHSVFLHARKLRRMAGVRDAENRVVRLEWLLNWATFFVARLISHVLITFKLVVDAPMFGEGIELPLAFCGMAGMNLLNFCLGIDLLKAYRRERRSQQRHQE